MWRELGHGAKNRRGGQAVGVSPGSIMVAYIKVSIRDHRRSSSHHGRGIQ